MEADETSRNGERTGIYEAAPNQREVLPQVWGSSPYGTADFVGGLQAFKLQQYERVMQVVESHAGQNSAVAELLKIQGPCGLVTVAGLLPKLAISDALNLSPNPKLAGALRHYFENSSGKHKGPTGSTGEIGRKSNLFRAAIPLLAKNRGFSFFTVITPHVK